MRSSDRTGILNSGAARVVALKPHQKNLGVVHIHEWREREGPLGYAHKDTGETGENSAFIGGRFYWLQTHCTYLRYYLLPYSSTTSF